MTWKQISFVWFALTAASAYRQIHTSPAYYFTGYQQPLLERRVDSWAGDDYDRVERVPSERSIPFKSNSQRVGGDYDRAERVPSERSIPFKSNSQRVDDDYGRAERVPSERSIPFKSNSQRVQAQEWTERNDEPEPRHGNITVKTSAFTKTYPSVSSRRGNPVDLDSVVFPGPTSRRASFEPEIPPNCMDTGICEAVPNYPHEYVNDLLSKIKDDQNRFNLDIETPEIAQRRGPGEENLELCQHKETIIYPKAAKNAQGKWVFIVNKDDQPVQGFKGEMCINANQSCSEIAYFSDKYKASCQQKRVERAMWSIDKDGNMIKESIPMPSCCTCIVKIVT